MPTPPGAPPCPRPGVLRASAPTGARRPTGAKGPLDPSGTRVAIRRRLGTLAFAAALAAGATAACDELKVAPSRETPRDAAAEAAAPRRTTLEMPLPPGCVRAGSVDEAEHDPTCLTDEARPEENEAALARLRLELVTDAPSTLPGGPLVLRARLRNLDALPLSVVLESEPRGAGTRPDVTQLLGLRFDASALGAAHFPFIVRTLDGRSTQVDRLRWTPPVAHATRRLARVHVPARGTLEKRIEWFAIELPAPPPPFEDDAGHKIRLKALPRNLAPGRYRVAVELPLAGVAPDRRTVAADVEVIRPPIVLKDGSVVGVDGAP